MWSLIAPLASSLSACGSSLLSALGYDVRTTFLGSAASAAAMANTATRQMKAFGNTRSMRYQVSVCGEGAVPSRRGSAAAAAGVACWGGALERVATLPGLGFSRVAPEQYDFLRVESRRGRPAVRAFLAALRDPATRARIAALGMQPSDA